MVATEGASAKGGYAAAASGRKNKGADGTTGRGLGHGSAPLIGWNRATNEKDRRWAVFLGSFSLYFYFSETGEIVRQEKRGLGNRNQGSGCRK